MEFEHDNSVLGELDLRRWSLKKILVRGLESRAFSENDFQGTAYIDATKDPFQTRYLPVSHKVSVDLQRHDRGDVWSFLNSCTSINHSYYARKWTSNLEHTL